MVTPAELVGLKAVTNAFVNIVMGRLDRVLAENYQIWKNVKKESRSLQDDLLFLAADVDDRQRAAPRTAVARVYGDQIRELTHDIEDCIERFLHCITLKAGASGPQRLAHEFMTVIPRFEFAAKIKELRNRVAEARERAKADVAVEAVQQAVEYVPSSDPVGITEATMELCRLLDVDPNEDKAEGTNIPAATHLRVVALVGFGGSGKTTLAKVVYGFVKEKVKLPCAWIDGHSLDNIDADGILENIRSQLAPGDMENRYLVVIDDIKEKDKHSVRWDTLRNAFRNNGRILVTTTYQSVAHRCCNPPRGEDRYSFSHVYNMRSLGKKDSIHIALGGKPAEELVLGSAKLLKKCGGHPLALYSVASRLRSEQVATGKLCKSLCNNLGTYLEREDDEPNFAKLRSVLREYYTSLSDYTVRSCLLYLGIFPMGRPLKKNVIIRRWLAEGYARHDKRKHQFVAEENFEIFMNRSIVQPVVPISNARGKMCKTNSIMHVFMLQTSKSKNFILPLGAQHEKARHFYMHDSNGGTSGTVNDIDVSCARSLTVLGKAGDALSRVHKYELARVLDLAGCIDVKDCHLKHICKLWNLRYLSLGPGITKIPKEIKQLKLLETLHVSKTRVNVLPVEAIGLPCLIHLIGKFKLQDPVKTERLPKEFMLETIAGFVVNKGRGFLQLMDHMKKLNKVKIWCASEETVQGQVDMNDHLSEIIRKYIETDMVKDNDMYEDSEGNDRSLSLYFQELPQGSLTALDQLYEHYRLRAGHLYLTSLKLHGNSNSVTLHNFVALFHDLTKLSVSTTMSVTQHLLSVLGERPKLLQLKMLANSIDDGFVIQDGKFKSLQHLCLVLEVVGPSVLAIEDGGGRKIISLQLICKDLVGLSGVKISHLPELKEIVLHPKMSKKTNEAWEAEARNHHNMPNVLYIPGDLKETNNSSEEAAINRVCQDEMTHEDQIRQEPAAVEEEPAHEDHMEVEPESNSTAPVNYPSSIGVHVNGVHEDCDKEALVQPGKQKKRKLHQLHEEDRFPKRHEKDIADTNMEDAGENLADSIQVMAL